MAVTYAFEFYPWNLPPHLASVDDSLLRILGSYVQCIIIPMIAGSESKHQTKPNQIHPAHSNDLHLCACG